MVDTKRRAQSADGYVEDAPGIVVVLSQAGYAGIVSLTGEHDLATRDQIDEVLGAVFGNVLVDLSDCQFMDSTVIVLLIARAQGLEREGHRLELVVPPSNVQMMRVVDVVGLRDLVPVHPSAPPRSASGMTAAGA